MSPSETENAVLSRRRLSDSAIRSLLIGLKAELQSLYAQKLRGIYLYGSYARDEAQWDSDVDVLIVLDEITRYGAEVDRSGHLVASVSLQFGVSVSSVFASERDWQSSENPFLTRVRTEAIPA